MTLTFLRSLLLTLFVGVGSMAVLHAAEPTPPPMAVQPNLQLCIPLPPPGKPEDDSDVDTDNGGDPPSLDVA